MINLNQFSDDEQIYFMVFITTRLLSWPWLRVIDLVLSNCKTYTCILTIFFHTTHTYLIMKVLLIVPCFLGELRYQLQYLCIKFHKLTKWIDRAWLCICIYSHRVSCSKVIWNRRNCRLNDIIKFYSLGKHLCPLLFPSIQLHLKKCISLWNLTFLGVRNFCYTSQSYVVLFSNAPFRNYL